jgi:hypothetical protein
MVKNRDIKTIKYAFLLCQYGIMDMNPILSIYEGLTDDDNPVLVIGTLKIPQKNLADQKTCTFFVPNINLLYHSKLDLPIA